MRFGVRVDYIVFSNERIFLMSWKIRLNNIFWKRGWSLVFNIVFEKYFLAVVYSLFLVDIGLIFFGFTLYKKI